MQVKCDCPRLDRPLSGFYLQRPTEGSEVLKHMSGWCFSDLCKVSFMYTRNVFIRLTIDIASTCSIQNSNILKDKSKSDLNSIRGKIDMGSAVRIPSICSRPWL